MASTFLILSLFLLGSFVAGLLVESMTKWRIWVVALAVSIIATVIGAISDPIHIELGNALVTFLPALGGAAWGSNRRRKRTA